MAIIIFIMGLFIGIILNIIITKICHTISIKKSSHNETQRKKHLSMKRVMKIIRISCKEAVSEKLWKRGVFVILISGALCLLSFLKMGFTILFIKGILLCSILIIVSFVDAKHKIIPNEVVVFTMIIGIIFSFIDSMTFINAILGMLAGGGILFLLALVPGALGGGDVKLMFALGSFLGVQKVLWAIFIAFLLAAIVSVLLLLFKIKGRKEHIPFGPFLALGTISSFLLLL